MSNYEDQAQCVTNVMNTYLRWKSLNGPPRGHEHFHPSAFGMCLRRMQYQRYQERGFIKVEPATFEARTIRIFDTGHVMHARWAKYWEDLGVLRGIWECANPCCGLWDKDKGYIGDHESCEFVKNEYPGISKEKILPPRKYGTDNKIGCFKPKECVCGCTNFNYHEITVKDESLNFKGHCDQILDFSEFSGSLFKTKNPVKVLFKDEDLPKKPIVIDMKSINSYGFKSKLEHGKAPFEYRVQVNIYIHVLDLEYGILYFENKDDCSTKIIPVYRDAELWNKIQEQSHSMNDMLENKLLPPPRPLTKEAYECKNCEFQPICHSKDIWKDPDLSNKRLKFYGDFS